MTSLPGEDAHPATVLDDVIHQRARLGIVVVLAEAGGAEFTYLRDTLGLTDGNVGQHIQVLLDHGLVSVKKTFERNRPRTWVQITAAGQAALDHQIAAMKALVSRIEATGEVRNEHGHHHHRGIDGQSG
jgi:DNA-binding MarR family transcriptional regulator